MPEKSTILYIEDYEANRELVGFLLDRMDSCTMIEAETGSQGLERAINDQPDLILLDISLPDVSGNSVLEQLKQDKRTAQIPVIALSGICSAQDVALGMERGFVDYLPKPLELEQFYSAIKKALG